LATPAFVKRLLGEAPNWAWLRRPWLSDRGFLEATRREQMGARNLFRSSDPLSTIWRHEFRAPKKSEMRTLAAEQN
jgi:hypothetical protein